MGLSTLFKYLLFLGYARTAEFMGIFGASYAPAVSAAEKADS
jgi:hypothetical protein